MAEFGTEKAGFCQIVLLCISEIPVLLFKDFRCLVRAMIILG